MISRRTLVRAASAALLLGTAGCSVDSRTAERAQRLQDALRHEPGVTSALVDVALRNESFTTGWRALVSMGSALSLSDQKALVFRFFALARQYGLGVDVFDYVLLTLPGNRTLYLTDEVTTAQIDGFLSCLAGLPHTGSGNFNPEGSVFSARALLLDLTVPQFLTLGSAMLVAVPRPPGIATFLDLWSDNSTLHASSLYCDSVPTPAGLGFVAVLAQWADVHGLVRVDVPFLSPSYRQPFPLRLVTQTDQSAAVRDLAQAARAAGIDQEVKAHLVEDVAQTKPYLVIPR